MAIITISRGTFSGGERIAELLGKRLGYTTVSREIILSAAAEYGVPEKKLDAAIEKEPNLKEYFAWDIDRSRYLSFIQAELCKKAKNDNIIYHGHGGHMLLKGISHVIKVKVIASMEQRISFAMEHNELTREEAIQYIHHIDRQRIKWTKFLYDVHWNASHLYDIVINLKKTTIPTACDMICAMVQADEFRTTEASARAMENLVLASRIKAVLASDDFSKYLDVKVKADDGSVTLSGRVHTMKNIDHIKELVRSTEGVKDLKCTCHPFYFELDKEDLSTLATLR